MANPGLFFVYFPSFQTNNTILSTKMSCPSSIRRQDSNPRPSDCGSPHITTRPGLPLNLLLRKIRWKLMSCKFGEDVRVVGRLPWSSGYGRRLMFYRSWVWNSITVYCKFVLKMYCLFQNTRNEWKKAGDCPFLGLCVFPNKMDIQKP